MVKIQEHPEIARVLATGEVAQVRIFGETGEDRMYEEQKEKELFSQPEEAVEKNPCADCWREAVCDNGCESWRSYYVRRQRRIQAAAKLLRQGGTPAQSKSKVICRRERQGGREREVFAYSHPDHVRRYLGKSPCVGCPLAEGCGIPCGRYLHWYDARMAWARARVELAIHESPLREGR